jgi:hypothetical protein
VCFENRNVFILVKTLYIENSEVIGLAPDFISLAESLFVAKDFSFLYSLPSSFLEDSFPVKLLFQL